jgi:hypothetical protein
MRYWKRETNGLTATVESYSHDADVAGAVEITKEEFDGFIAAIPAVAPVQSRDLAKEVDGLKTDVANLMKVFI